MKITGETRVVGLLGYPVGHTLSPIMHNQAFTHLNMDWFYLPFEVKPENLKEGVVGLSALGVRGVNLTIPYKIEAMKYLTGIDEKAKRIGACNTIVFNEDGITGYNTDGDGFVKSLKDIGFEVKDKNVYLIGCGGAGRAIGISLAASGIKKLALFDVSQEKKESLKKTIEEFTNCEVFETLKERDLLINATPLGMKENDPMPCDVSSIHKDMLVYDIIYKKTPLLIEAEKRGAKIMNGIEMLIHQGAESFEIWTGVYPPIDVMRKAIITSQESKARCWILSL